MKNGYNLTVQRQCELLEEILKENKGVYSVVESLSDFKLPNAYVAAGCISQTVWNYQEDYDISYGINDIDLIYFDGSDLSAENEAAAQLEIDSRFLNIGYKIDVTNEARTHLWYERKFGKPIPPYDSSEAAINSWIPATAIGVRYEGGAFAVYAPYGMNDMFGQIVRPNKSLVTKDYFMVKSSKWKSKWTRLSILDW